MIGERSLINCEVSIRDAGSEINELPEEFGEFSEVDEMPEEFGNDYSKNVLKKDEVQTVYYDDYGKIYRIGDSLVPENTYEVKGYLYETDSMGRITSASGELRIKQHEGRLPLNEGMDKIGKGDGKETDDRGHLIGDQFDGCNRLENLVPMDAKLNRGDFVTLENRLADAVKDGKKVYLKVEPVYSGDSYRPDGFWVTYSIDGEESVVYFENGGSKNE